MNRTKLFLGSFALLTVFCVSSAAASDWPRFRGPNGSGITADTESLPTTWSETENLKWKIALPGPGSSSPIVVGDKLFVTCWTGYGIGRGSSGDQKNLRRHLLCLDRNTGKTLWSKEVAPVLPEDNYGGMFAEHGYASHTPVSDGMNVYAFFGKTGVYAYDLNGKELWHKSVGEDTDRRNWGSASSPVLYKDLLIVTASAESQSLVALNKNTGEQVWKKEAEGFASVWGTPIIVDVPGKEPELVLGVPFEIWGFNPATGKLNWFCEAPAGDQYCSSVVAANGVVYGIEGRGGGSIAVKAGGSGDVTKEGVVWSGRDNNRIGSPIVHDGKLYFVSGKIANCIDAKTGAKVFQSRLTGGSPGGDAGGGRGPGGIGGPGGQRPQGGQRPGGPGGFGGPGGGMGGQDYSSCVAGDGKLYYIARNGDGYVLKLSDKFEQLSMNRVTKESEDFSATPAIAGGDLFIRSSKHLYCVSSAKPAK